MFLRAKLKSGGFVVSEFTELQKVQKYASDIFAGREVFNVWRLVGTTHPVSGEPNLQRTRRIISGADIIEIQQVQPAPGFETTHNFDPDRFDAVVVSKEGERGMWYVPNVEGLPQVIEVEGITIPHGVGFPKHRDEQQMREFVYVRFGREASEGVEAQTEVRYYLDGRPRDPYAPQPSSTSSAIGAPAPHDPDDEDSETEFDDIPE